MMDYRLQNSVEGHDSIKPEKSTLHRIILGAMEQLRKPSTFREIARQAGLKPEQCWRRMSELEKEEKVEVTGKTKDSITGRNVSLWSLKIKSFKQLVMSL